MSSPTSFEKAYQHPDESAPSTWLLSDDDAMLTTDRAASPLQRPSRHRQLIFTLSLLLNLCLVLFVSFVSLSSLRSPSYTAPYNDPVYSPARSAVRYKQQVFTALGAKTKYNGPPTNETDENWNLLYPIGLSKLSDEDAAKLYNYTEPYKGSNVIILDVFHQLHCLNLIRKAFYPERYGNVRFSPPVMEGGDNPFDHVDHCINALREAVMCNADITPFGFKSNPWSNRTDPQFNAVHTCKDWDAISDWAAANRYVPT